MLNILHLQFLKIKMDKNFIEKINGGKDKNDIYIR
jgi:hypothetical protein